jgi:hypothetical protein
MLVRPATWKHCRSAARGTWCLAAAALVALAPGLRVERSAPPRPAGLFLQAGRNEARERRLRLCRWCRGVAADGSASSGTAG